MINQEVLTKGYWYGYIFRRIIHISIIFVPYLYENLVASVAEFCHVAPLELLLWLTMLVLLFEGMRLLTGVVFFGQRKHEAKRLSSFTWGWLGLVFVIAFSPSPAFASAIIWSLALGDPCLGEARRYLPKKMAALVGTFVIFLVWAYSAQRFNFSLAWAFVMAPLTVAAEWKSSRWVDDNLLMLVVPLIGVLIGEFAIK